MASMADTWSPSSLQLRLAFTPSNSWKLNRAFFVRPTRLRKLDARIRTLCVAPSGNDGVQTRRNWGSWAGSDNGPENSSGWSGSEDGPATASRGKIWLGGMVGAGVVLIGGITVAAFSIGNKSNSMSKQEMKPLTTQQEAFLTQDEQNLDREIKDQVPDMEKENVDASSERSVGTDSPVFSKGDDILRENGSVDQIALESLPGEEKSPSAIEVDMNLSKEENLAEKSTFGGSSVAPYASLSSTESTRSNIGGVGASEYKDSYERHNSDATLSAAESSENLVPDESTSFYNKENKPSDNKSLNVLNESINTQLDASVPVDANVSISSDVDSVSESHFVSGDKRQKPNSPSAEESVDMGRTSDVSIAEVSPVEGVHSSEDSISSEPVSITASIYSKEKEPDKNGPQETDESTIFLKSPIYGNTFSAGIPAPSILSESLQVSPGKVLVPPTVDQVHGQALAALQAFKVIEADVQPGDLCTRREYARWLVSASSLLSRTSMSKVYPAMYIENVTELAFDDITPNDPDFVYIQGLAEAGLIASKLSRRDMMSSTDEIDSPYYFFPESPLSRQDLVSWKMALEKKQLPEANKEVLRRLSGFIDVDKIHPDACPALVADLSAEQGIVALAFGYTKLFQPDKPVTKAQAAIALATGEAADVVSEELARIEAESMAENAVAAHNALVSQVEKDVNESFEKVLSVEREKIDAVEKMAEEARSELEKLRARREEDNISLMKERAAVESEMELLSKLRQEVEEQLETLLSNKVEISYEKERVNKLRTEAEKENQEIARLQYELEVERKALSMARAWAEDEARRAREHAKALEEARDRWERQGIKVVVDSELQEETSEEATWLNAGKQFSVEETVSRGENLKDKLRDMAASVHGKSREFINKIVEKILVLLSDLKKWSSGAGKRTEEFREVVVARSTHAVEELQQAMGGISQNLKEGAKRLAVDCRDGVEKLTQRFKT